MPYEAYIHAARDLLRFHRLIVKQRISKGGNACKYGLLCDVKSSIRQGLLRIGEMAISFYYYCCVNAAAFPRPLLQESDTPCKPELTNLDLGKDELEDALAL